MAIQNTSTNQAGAYATATIGQLNQFAPIIRTANSRVNSGSPAILAGGIPAVLPSEYADALGPIVTAKVKLIAAALDVLDETKLIAALAALA